jgi:hypothetical protein
MGGENERKERGNKFENLLVVAENQWLGFGG